MIKYSFVDSLNPVVMIKTYWVNRRLIKQFSGQDFAGKFKGSFLGLLWPVIVPLLMLLVYTVVFSVIFQAKWGTIQGQSQYHFALMLFGGLVPFNIFAEAFGCSPDIIRARPNLVKKIVFPLEILPLSKVLSAFYQGCVNLLILGVGLALVNQLSFDFLWFPVLYAPIVLFALGLSYLGASIGVFVRDLAHFIGIAISLILFLAPIFYPMDAVPEQLRFYLALNPLANMIQEARDVLVLGRSPEWVAVGSSYLIGGSICLIGFAWFRRTKHSFADVM